MDVNTCFAHLKQSENEKNYNSFYGSSQQVSYWTSTDLFLQAFKKDDEKNDSKKVYAHADFDHDTNVTRAEAKIYEMINTNWAITPFFWKKPDGSRVRLAEQSSTPLLGEQKG